MSRAGNPESDSVLICNCNFDTTYNNIPRRNAGDVSYSGTGNHVNLDPSVEMIGAMLIFVDIVCRGGTDNHRVFSSIP